jgi:hypothetical protein
MRYFTPTHNHFGQEKDGRAYVIAHKNVPIPVAQAERLGIIPTEGATPEQLTEDGAPERTRRAPRVVAVVAPVETAAGSAGAADTASAGANAPHAPNAGAHDPSGGQVAAATRKPRKPAPAAKSDGAGKKAKGKGAAAAPETTAQADAPAQTDAPPQTDAAGAAE